MINVIRELQAKERVIILVILGLISFLLFFDIWSDFKEGSSITHVLFELGILMLALFGIITQLVVYFRQKRDLMSLKLDLVEARNDLAKYKESSRSFIEGLSGSIDEQFEKWNLTKAEKDISLLLLKGLSNKQIAEIRATSENTVRQQISSIFQKSKIKSRLELTSFFLEDLLLPE